MGLKSFEEYSAEEIGLWLTAQGLGEQAPKFLEEGVDGDLLCSLSIDDLKNDLGLSGLQAKKVLKNIEFSKHLKDAGENGGGGGEEAEKLKEEIQAITGRKEEYKAKAHTLEGDKASLEEKIQALEEALNAKDDEIAHLKHDMEKLTVKAVPEPVAQAAPAPAPKPAPQSHHQPQRRQPGVIGGAARGAAGGAVKGAVMGAILPGMDAGDGAAAGAAVGALGGGARGLRGRRGRRFR